MDGLHKILYNSSFNSSIGCSQCSVELIKIPRVKSPRQGTKLGHHYVELLRNHVAIVKVIEQFHPCVDELKFYKPVYYWHAS